MPETRMIREAYEPRARASGRTREPWREMLASRTHVDPRRSRSLMVPVLLSGVLDVLDDPLTGAAPPCCLRRRQHGVDPVARGAHDRADLWSVLALEPDDLLMPLAQERVDLTLLVSAEIELPVEPLQRELLERVGARLVESSQAMMDVAGRHEHAGDRAGQEEPEEPQGDRPAAAVEGHHSTSTSWKRSWGLLARRRASSRDG